MIYLNNSATSFPKPECVVQTVECAMREPLYDAARGAGGGEDIAAVCRERLAALLGTESERIFFTSGATESFNLLLRGLPLAGKRICISCYEHNALVKPLYALAEAGSISVLTPDAGGAISLAAWERAAAENDYVFVNHCSNVTGQVQDIRAIAGICRRHAALCICDLSQSAGLLDVSLGAWGIDAAVFTGHKALFGTTGTGGFYLRRGLELQCPKWGGTGRNGGSVFPTEPERGHYEVGTQNLLGLAGLSAGVGYVLARGEGDILRAVRRHTRRMLAALREMDAVRLYTPAADSNIIAFNFRGLLPADTAYIMGEMYGITLRAGFHCAPLLADIVGEGQGSVRASVSCLTADDDVDAFISAAAEINRSLR